MEVGTPTCRRRGLHFWLCLVLDGDDRHVVPEALGRVERQERKLAVAGNQADAHVPLDG